MLELLFVIGFFVMIGHRRIAVGDYCGDRGGDGADVCRRGCLR